MDEFSIGPDSPGRQEMTVLLQVAIKIMDKRQLGEDLPRIRLEIAAMKVGGGRSRSRRRGRSRRRCRSMSRDRSMN